MSPTPPPRCWAEIDRAALRHNARAIRTAVGGGVELLAVVKANAYGHGIEAVARALRDEVHLFAVANLAEARELRDCVNDRPILMLGPAAPDERAIISDSGFVATVSSHEEAAAFAQVSVKPALLNVEIDTGMGRMGCAETQAFEAVQQIAQLENARLHSISTHLPAADDDPAFTRDELQRFDRLVRQIREAVPGSYKIHALPTAGALRFPDYAYDYVRAGLALYGVSPLPEMQHMLRPALSLKTRVVLIRDIAAGATISYGRTFTARRPMRVATLGAGYADGYVRALSNSGAAVLIRGKRCAVLGIVTMDLLVADVSEIGDVQVGEEVVLIGRQGDEEVGAFELAKRAGTIPWEIFTGIGSRVARVYC